MRLERSVFHRKCFFTRFLFLFSLLFFCSLSSAQTSTPPVKVECGTSRGDIKPLDGSICQEDIAFGVLYEIFPAVFDELRGSLSLDFFKFDNSDVLESQRLGEFNGNAVFFVFFDLFHTLVIGVVIVYFSTLLLSVLFRLIQGDELTTDHGLQRDNFKSWVTGAAVGASFLLPIKNGLFLGTILIFFLGTLSLSAANFVASTFWSSQQNIFKSTLKLEDVAQPKSSSRVWERHDFLSDSFYRYLTRMQMCRQESASMALTKIASELTGSSEAGASMKCLAASSKKPFSVGGVNQSASFVKVVSAERVSGMNDGERSFRDLSEVVFGSNFRQSSECSDTAELVPDSVCGSIEVHNPDWAGNPVLGLIDDPWFIDQQLTILGNSLTPQMSYSDIERLVSEGWGVIHTRIISELTKNIAESELSGSTVRQEVQSRLERDASIAALTDANADGIRQLARFYHQSAYNILLFGRHVESKDTSGWFSDESYTVEQSSMSSIFYHLDKAKLLSDKLIQIQCLSAIQNLASAKKFEEFIQGNVDTLPPDAHAKCVNVDTGRVWIFDEFSALSSEQITQYLINKNKTLREEFYSEWLKVTGDLAEKRRAIERSFYNAVQDEEQHDWWVRMRKEGYLAVADYARNINAHVVGYKRDLRLMINSYTLGAPVYDSRYLAKGLDPQSLAPAVFSDAIEADSVLNGAAVKGKSIDPLVERYHWLSGQDQLLRQPKLQEGEPLDLNQVLSAIENPMTHMNRLGIDIHGGKSLEECPNDPGKCPFPLTDPLVELSLMGHDMIDTGISFYSIAIGMKTGVYLLRKLGNSAKQGTYEERSKVDGAVRKAKVVKRIGVSAMSAVPGIFDVIFEILGMIMIIYIAVGSVLAYILPMMPFLYLYMNFIAWLMVLTMSAFAILLWCFLWVRFREKKHIIKQAGIQYGLEILLKPMLSLVSVLFAVFFFYVSTFVVGITMGWLMEMPLAGEGGGGLRAFTDPLFIILIISAVYFAILKYSYNQMDEFIGALMTKLGVRHKNARDGMSDTMKAVLFDAVQSKLKQLNTKMNRDKELEGLNQRKQRALHTVNSMHDARGNS